MATFFSCFFASFYVTLWDMIAKQKQIIRLSLSAESFGKARTAALARDVSIEELFLKYVENDYIENGEAMEAHLDAKSDYMYEIQERGLS